MAQTPEGARKIAAARAGMTLEDFLARNIAEKRCTRCKEWRSRSQFNTDRSRHDLLTAACNHCTRVKVRVDTRGRPSQMKGKKFSADARRNMGRQSGFVSSRRGIPRTLEEREKIRVGTRLNTPRGEAHPFYKGGVLRPSLSLRRVPEYFLWRTAVFERDAYTCQDCGDNSGGNLRAHHDKPLAKFPELAHDLANGVTLCDPCHQLRHYKPDSIRNERKRRRGERLWK